MALDIGIDDKLIGYGDETFRFAAANARRSGGLPAVRRFS